MPRRLPPLNPLRAFEAGARHLSFTRAAEDLSVTQTAISHQVRRLEDWVGRPLFRREARGLALTGAGRALYAPTAEAFDRIAEAAARVRESPDTRTLTVSLTPTFGSRWLAERLGRFWREHPDIDLRLHHSVQLADLAVGDVDLAVRWGRGAWPGAVAERLMRAEVMPLCSPALLTGERALRAPADLAHHTLLHERDYQEWTEWLAAAGVGDVDGQRGPIIGEPHVIVRAAERGDGVMMGIPSMLREELAAGRLVAPFGERPDPDLAYYVVHAPGALARAKVRAFRDFLVEEVRADGVVR